MLYRILILSAILAAVSTLRLLGAEKCTWGPSHWCASLENAKNCGANSEEYCRKKVWVGDHPLAHLTKPIPEDAKPAGKKPSMAMAKIISPFASKLLAPKDGQNCYLCELIGKEIFMKLKNNATEEEVVEEMEHLCQLLPVSYVDSCTQFVEEYGKAFWDEFVDGVSVHDLCAYLGLCSEEFWSIVKENNLIAMVISRNFEGMGCETCQALTGLVQKEVLENKAALESLLDSVCSELPVDQDECHEYVDEMFETVVDLFESYTPKELCEMVGLCSTLLENLAGPGPVAFGQVGQTGPASAENMLGTDDSEKENVIPMPRGPLGTDDSCENGPAFWCDSKENAKLCKMEMYCANLNQEAPLFF